MKKILFNDKFLLTQAVLEGRKTQTRRKCREQVWGHSDIISARNGIFHFEIPKYKIGEIIAVAQSYRDCGGVNAYGVPMWEIISQRVGSTNAGWDNKMFVRADLMPHQIRITDVRVERLQDISDVECLKEGIQTSYYGDCKFPPDGYTFDNGKSHFNTPREAFAHLINKVSKKGTWESNPYVFVYDFELVHPLVYASRERNYAEDNRDDDELVLLLEVESP